MKGDIDCLHCKYIQFYGYPNTKQKCTCFTSDYYEKEVEDKNYCDEFEEYIMEWEDEL
jgi:hypothetical protein